MRDESGNPIGRRHDNPILDSRIYEVEFSFGENMSLAANTIEENMLAKVNEQGNSHIIIDEIIDLRTDGTQVRKDDALITLKSVAKWYKETNKPWQVLVQWKYGITTWNDLKDVKE